MSKGNKKFAMLGIAVVGNSLLTILLGIFGLYFDNSVLWWVLTVISAFALTKLTIYYTERRDE